MPMGRIEASSAELSFFVSVRSEPTLLGLAYSYQQATSKQATNKRVAPPL